MNRRSSLSLNTVEKTSVESILVSTGVYNPQNDLLYHLTHLFDEAIASKEPEPVEESDENPLFLRVSTLNSKSKNSSTTNLVDIEKNELRSALSRKNSFISYFDNRLNVPDITVGNFLDAVQLIISSL